MSESRRGDLLEREDSRQAHTAAALLEGHRREPPELIPARMINEVLYCPRLMYLEWVQGEFEHNEFTLDGESVHRRADQPKGELPAPDGEYDPSVVRSLWLSSERLGITAKIDVVDVGDDRTVTPIEYKRGKSPDLPERAYLPERAQVCAQVLLLREHGYRCDEAFIYFAGDRRRVPIDITEELERTTLDAAERIRAIVRTGIIPPPLDDSPKCGGCSLIGICLPDEVNCLREDDAPSEDARAGETTRAVRRLHPARDEKLPLYVQEPGARISLSGDNLLIKSRTSTETTTAKLPLTSEVSLFNPVQITTQAMTALLREGIPVQFFSSGGWFNGRLVSHDSNNVELRIAQHQAAIDGRFCLALARGFVSSKIRNCRTLLRRNHHDPPELALKEMKRLAESAEACASIESLLGVEGTAARIYFGEFCGMLKGADEMAREFDENGRNRRPPRDPVNALLSFTYALLSKDVTLACAKVGLDPLLGFYHQPRFGRPALALDLMEEFRPLIADSTVIGVINNGVITDADFVRRGVSVAIDPAARKRLIYAYERRMDQLITHPVFGYRISYRRVLEVQARLLARMLMGEIDRYPEFVTR